MSLGKMITPNIVQAKKILDSIPAGDYFEAKYDMVDGKDAKLKIYPSNLIAFANKEKSDNNILDKLDKIGKLLAESLLTKTTTHKLNDFKDVYYSSKQELEKFRKNLFLALNAVSMPEKGGNSILADDDAKKLIELVKDDNMNDAFDRLGVTIYKGIDKAAIKKRKNFISKLKSYYKNINKNVGVIKKILGKRGELQEVIDAELRAIPADDFASNAETALKDECGYIGDKLDKIYVKYSTKSCVYLVTGQSFMVTVHSLGLLAPVCPIVSLVGINIFFPLALLLNILALFSMPGPKLGAFIKKYKKDCNKVKQASTQMFKIIREEAQFILESAKEGGKSFEASIGLNDACVPIIESFEKNTKKIWNNYADDKNREYDYFENKMEISELERENTQRRARIVKIDFSSKIIDEAVQKYKVKSYNNLSDTIKESLSEVCSYSVIKEMRKKNMSVNDIKIRLSDSKSYEEGEISKNNDSIKEKENTKKGRSREKKSSMGLFKNGYAATLANFSYIE